METRLISFANSALAIHYQGQRSTEIVDFLFQHVSANTQVSPDLTYYLLPTAPGDHLLLYRDDTLLYLGDSPAIAAEVLLGDAGHNLAAQNRGGVLFHAAGLTWQKRGLLLPGATGAGKSALAAWLLSQGFSYLTDELVFVPWGTISMEAFIRPLTLKRSSKLSWPNDFGVAEQLACTLSTPHSHLIMPSQVGAVNPLADLNLSLIIFPQYHPGSDFTLRPLTKAQAGLALLQCLLNARNLPEYGFAEVTRLARQIRAYQIRYSHFTQIDQQIETLLSAGLAEER